VIATRPLKEESNYTIDQNNKIEVYPPPPTDHHNAVHVMMASRTLSIVMSRDLIPGSMPNTYASFRECLI